MANRELTEDIDDPFSLLPTVAHTGFNQYGIHDTKDNADDYDAATGDINESHSLSCAYKGSLGIHIYYKVVEDLVGAWKEGMA